MPITGSARSPDSRRGLVSRAVKSTVPGIGIECRPANGRRTPVAGRSATLMAAPLSNAQPPILQPAIQ